MSTPHFFRNLIAFSILGFAFVSVGHSFEENTNKFGDVKYGAIERQFENGFRALLLPDAKAEQTAVTLVYFSGSLVDPEGKSGLAHLVEHLLFNASTSQGALSLVGELARRNIKYNGNTNFDRTIYHSVFSYDQETVNWLLEQEALRMHALTIGEADITRELSVVLREKELGESNKGQKTAQNILPAVTHFPAYARQPIGSEVELRSITKEDAQVFYQQNYRPDNALVVITGRFDTQTTLNQLANHFGKIKLTKVKAPTESKTAFPVINNNSPEAFHGEGDIASVSLVYPLSPSANAEQVAGLNLLSRILAGSPASRLQSSLVDSSEASAVLANPLILRNANLFQVTAIPTRGKQERLDQIRNLLIAQLKSLKTKPITKVELDRAKDLIRNESSQVRSNASVFGYRLAEFASSADWRLWFESLEAAEKISLTEIQQAANSIFGQAVPVALLIANHQTDDSTADTQPIPQQSFSGVLPLPAALSSNSPESATLTSIESTAAELDAQIERFTINNSLAVALWPKPEADRVQGLWNLRMGTAQSMFGKRILAAVTGSMLIHGSENINRLQLFDRLVAMNASLSITPADDRLTIRFDLPAKSLQEFLGMLSDILRNPAFPEQGFNEVRNQLQVAYQSQITTPQIVAEEGVAAFTSNYPIGDIRREPSKAESLAALAAIELNTVKAFHADYFGANGEFMLTGDFDAKAIRKQLEDLLGSWRSKQAYQRPSLPYAGLVPGQHYLAVPQAAHGIYTAKLRWPLQAGESDALALELVNFIFGEDALQSRLGQRLRVKDGISYSVATKVGASAFEPRATFTIDATYVPSMRQQLAKAVHEELALLVKNGLTETEFNKAKDNWRNRNELSKLGHDRLFEKLNLLLRLRRDMQYYAQINARVDALTLAEVNASIARHINPDQLLEVFVDSEVSGQANASNEP